MKPLIRIALIAIGFSLHGHVWRLHFECVDALCESPLGEGVNRLPGAMYFVVTESLLRFPFGLSCFLLGLLGALMLRSSRERLLVWIPVGLLLRTVVNWTTADVTWDTARSFHFTTEILAEASAIPMLIIGILVSQSVIASRSPRWRVGDLLGLSFAAALLIASSRNGQSSVLLFCCAVLWLSCQFAIVMNRNLKASRQPSEPSISS